VGQISCSGALIVGPGDTAKPFPGSETTVALALKNTECTVVQPGLNVVASPLAFVALPAGVTKGLLLYVRTDNPVTLRLTTLAGAQVVPVDGLFLAEFPSTDPLLLLEVQGSATIEYLVAGQS
jgi:hypothetical protein